MVDTDRIWSRMQPDQYRLVTAGVKWPNIIYLTYPNNRSRDPSDRAPFSLDWTAVRREGDMLKRVSFRVDVDKEIATYEGLLVTYRDLERRVSPGIPGALRLGFGPTGLGAPCQLIIRTVSDVVVLKGKVGGDKR